MASFGRAREDWLRARLGLSLPHGIPSHDTFARVFARLDPEQFACCFEKWTHNVQSVTRGDVIAVDGKTLRRSFDTANGKAALHVVSAWAGSNRLVLGQLAVNDKSNEIKAVPALLQKLEIAGCIVTADALNCQKEVANQVVSQKGDYLLALKGNHRHLYEDVVAQFEWARVRETKGVARETLYSGYAETSNFGHGRSEKRRCWCIALEGNDHGFTSAQQEWAGLRTLVLLESERKTQQHAPEANSQKTYWSPASLERRYYLTSLPPHAERILGAVREHWGIENSLHWVLDVVFNEDQSRIRKDHAPKNMSLLRHLGLNLLRLENSHKAGLKSKRLRAGWDVDYLLAILAGGKY